MCTHTLIHSKSYTHHTHSVIIMGNACSLHTGENGPQFSCHLSCALLAGREILVLQLPRQVPHLKGRKEEVSVNSTHPLNPEPSKPHCTFCWTSSPLLLNFFPCLSFQPKENCGPRGCSAVILTRVPRLDSKTKPCSTSRNIVAC